MNSASRKWPLCLSLCLAWLMLCGFSELGTETTAGIGSVMNELTGEDLEEFKVQEEWEDRVLANVNDYVSVRAEANAEAKIIGRLFKGDGGYVTERLDGWTRIRSGNVEGYVSNEYLLFGVDAYERAQEELSLVATVNTNGLRIRSEAGTDSRILKCVEAGTKLEVVQEDSQEDASGEEDSQEAADEGETPGEETTEGEEGIVAEAMTYTADEEDSQDMPEGEWVCVQYAEEKTGYVSAEYVSLQYELGEGMTMEEIKKKEQEEKREKLKQQLAAFKANGNETVLLAALIQAEAGGQPYDGKVAVGAVVMNRVKSGRYPNSIAEVIYAPGQFGPISNGSIARYLNGPSASCMQAAQDAINGYTTIGTYTHFRRAGADVGGDSIVIGSHVFY